MMSAPSFDPYCADACIDLLCFDVGAERFAIPLAQVDRVAEGCDVLTVNSGERQRLVMRVHGELIAVHEPSGVLQAQRVATDPVALLLDARGVLIALLVDGAETALQISLSGLRTPPHLMRTDRVLDGLLRVQTRWVRLVNAAALADALCASTRGASTRGASALGASIHENFPVAPHDC